MYNSITNYILYVQTPKHYCGNNLRVQHDNNEKKINISL